MVNSISLLCILIFTFSTKLSCRPSSDSQQLAHCIFHHCIHPKHSIPRSKGARVCMSIVYTYIHTYIYMYYTNMHLHPWNLTCWYEWVCLICLNSELATHTIAHVCCVQHAAGHHPCSQLLLTVHSEHWSTYNHTYMHTWGYMKHTLPKCKCILVFSKFCLEYGKGILILTHY